MPWHPAFPQVNAGEFYARGAEREARDDLLVNCWAVLWVGLASGLGAAWRDSTDGELWAEWIEVLDRVLFRRWHRWNERSADLALWLPFFAGTGPAPPIGYGWHPLEEQRWEDLDYPTDAVDRSILRPRGG